MNVFERALEIIEERGWYAGDWHGPRGQVCIQQAWELARAELDPAPKRRWWQREIPWRVHGPYRARADAEADALRAAIEQVTGEKLWGSEAQWNDERANEEDVRLALKIAGRNLEGAAKTRHLERRAAEAR